MSSSCDSGDCGDDRYSPGLENIIASETALSYLDVEKEEIVLRGYSLIELARQTGYVDVAHLLIEGSLPTSERRLAVELKLKAEEEVPGGVYESIRLLPQGAHAMDMLRTAISALGCFDEELEDFSPASGRRKAYRLLAKLPQITANGYRILNGLEPVAPRSDLAYSAGFLYLLTNKKPTELEAHVFDQSLVAYSEHEMPNSTFAARVIASTMSDMYGAVTGAAASLKGRLHGGANEAVMKMLEETSSSQSLEALMLEKLAKKERIMGFGHRVYMRKPDPRALLMKEALRKLAAASCNHELYHRCEAGEAVMKREKGLYPNLDYYAAPVYHLLGIPVPLFTPVFLAARATGLCAHVIEQHEHNRLFRPRVLYRGPKDLHP
ncbi:citrate synthase [Paenibacillus sp. HB172176]|uniref:citrate synthase n=1 Tax=Paenibacillus sp. HB172176 TaxID=2493690 RepID=UPI0014399181|nr:citrate synthase [Paenibacillus sp. HB172176]